MGKDKRAQPIKNSKANALRWIGSLANPIVLKENVFYLPGQGSLVGVHLSIFLSRSKPSQIVADN